MLTDYAFVLQSYLYHNGCKHSGHSSYLCACISFITGAIMNNCKANNPIEGHLSVSLCESPKTPTQLNSQPLHQCLFVSTLWHLTQQNHNQWPTQKPFPLTRHHTHTNNATFHLPCLACTLSHDGLLTENVQLSMLFVLGERFFFLW